MEIYQSKKEKTKRKRVQKLPLFTILIVIFLSIGYPLKGQVSGSIDHSFNVLNSGPTASWSIYRAAIQDNGSIILLGRFKKYNKQKRRRLLRVHPDGSFDNTFEVGYKFNRGGPHAVAIQEDGKILVGGNFTRFRGERINHILRLHSDGSLDTSFNSGRGFGPNCSVDHIRILPEGKILLQGDFSYYNGYKSCGFIRLLSDGSVDSSFVGRTLCNVEDVGIRDILVQSDGKFIIVGRFWEYDKDRGKGIARVNLDGTLDRTFFYEETGLVSTFFGAGNGSVSTIAMQTDGSLILGGSFTRFAGRKARYLAKLNNDQALDTTFNSGRGPSFFIESLVIQPDGKILIASMSKYNKVKVNSIVRIHPDSSLDTTFRPNQDVIFHLTTRFHALIQQPDGKILVLSQVSTPSGNKQIVRLHN